MMPTQIYEYDTDIQNKDCDTSTGTKRSDFFKNMWLYAVFICPPHVNKLVTIPNLHLDFIFVDFLFS